jgi:LacI family transcriptional regulator
MRSRAPRENGRIYVRKPAHAVTIKDIAAELNLSHSTVSRALNNRTHISEETKERVRQAAKKLGYVPNLSARMIRGDASALVGLVIPDLKSDFFAALSKSLAERCRNSGLRLLLAITDDDPVTECNEVRALIESRVSGIVATLSGAPDPALLQMLAATPVVQLLRRTTKLHGPAVCMSDEEGCKGAVEHLLALGHRRIAYIGPSRAISAGEDRVRGFLRAHEQANVKPLEKFLELVPQRQADGAAAVERLLARKPRPTALVISNSDLTIGAMHALRARGLEVPADISVVGCGDPAWTDLLTPPLTTMGFPVEELADAAMAHLLRAIQAEDAAPSIEITRIAPKLVVRGSTAPPRKS